jgi:hypothetical protein
MSTHATILRLAIDGCDDGVRHSIPLMLHVGTPQESCDLLARVKILISGLALLQFTGSQSQQARAYAGNTERAVIPLTFIHY